MAALTKKINKLFYTLAQIDSKANKNHKQKEMKEQKNNNANERLNENKS